MRKITTILIFACLASLSGLAQGNSLGSMVMRTKLVMHNAMQISFNNGNNSLTGQDITLVFDDVNDYANGVESSPIELKVNSNKKFHVWVKTGANKFTYTGSTTPAPQMRVNKLKIKVVSNNTGGVVPSSVDNVYRNLSTTDKKVIRNGKTGGNNTFAIQYKADPGYEYPAGTYTVNVIYTATQK